MSDGNAQAATEDQNLNVEDTQAVDQFDDDPEADITEEGGAPETNSPFFTEKSPDHRERERAQQPPKPKANATTPAKAAQPEATAPESQTDADAETFSLEEARRLRRENANRRKEVQALREQIAEMDKLKAKLTEIEEASLSDRERLERKLERLEAERQELRSQTEKLSAAQQEKAIENEVIRLCAKLNIQDDDAAFRLMDRSEIEFDSDGRVQNVDKALKNLIKAKGWLVKAPEEPRERELPANPGRASARNESSEPKESDEERRIRIYGSGGSLWTNPRRHGGGVFMPKL